MQLLVYTAPFVDAGRMKKMLDGRDGDRCCLYFTALSALAAYLRKPLGFPSICILAPADERELTQLNGMRHLLRDMRIVLILPDGEPQTISEAHYLRPRHVAYADGNLADVKAVVDKMSAIETRPQWQVAG
jgi:hypothetical protein